MNNFVAKVKNVDRNFVLLAFVSVPDAAWLQRLFRLRNVTRSFKRHVMLSLAVEQTEMIVVRTGHQHSEHNVRQQQQDHHLTAVYPEPRQAYSKKTFVYSHATFVVITQHF